MLKDIGYGETYRFAGFVDPSTANRMVSEGHLFFENLEYHGLLSHGKYSHAFQKIIEHQAVKQGLIERPEGYTLVELHALLVDDKSPVNWSTMHDEFLSTTFHHPQYINSLLMIQDKLPLLRSFLRDSYFKHMHRKIDDKYPGVPPMIFQVIEGFSCVSRLHSGGYYNPSSLEKWAEGRNLEIERKDQKSNVYIKNSARLTGLKREWSMRSMDESKEIALETREAFLESDFS